jgi:lipoprotein-releasing system ATP-binding protein
MSKILTLQHVQKTFSNGGEDLHVLEDINLEIAGQSTVVLTGDSGSGKSTLLNLIAGLDYVTSGEVKVKEYEIQNLSEVQLTHYRMFTIGLVFQFHYLLKDFTAIENVMLPAYMAGKKRDMALSLAKELLKQVRLENRMDHYTGQLSGGERQRVAVARALINQPDIILADEPTGNLDEDNSRVVEDMLFSLVEQYGKTLLLVTHDHSLRSRGTCHFHLEKGVLKEE